MPLLVNSVPNLAQGVSQQPDSLRYPGQCDEQVNAWATVVEGLVKRPNTNFVSKVSTSSGAGLFTHFVKRDEQNKYCVTVSLCGVGVINLEDGTNYPVSISTFANQYLSLGTSVTNPLADLRALTVADYTFLVNKNRTVAKSTSKSKPLDKEALVAVKLGDYEKSYSIYIDDLVVPNTNVTGLNYHHTPQLADTTYESGPAGQGWHADTEVIAQDLGILIDDYFNTASTGVTDITITNAGSGYESAAVLAFNPFRPEFSNFILYEVRVTVEQYNTSNELVGTGAKGIARMVGGEIQSVTITNKGSGYLKTTDTGYTDPIVTLQEYGYRFQKWEPVKTWTTQATATATVADVQPIKVVTNGSVIKLTRTSYVENDGYYYKCIQDHTSSSTTEPGTGADWEEYWESWDKTDLADDWATATDYTIGTDFSVRVSDGLSDQGLDVIYKEVASITDLPKKCYNNFRVKVAGDADIDQDDYYVKFSTKDKLEFGEGSWVEVHGWYQNDSPVGEVEALDIGIDQTTMPVTLVPVVSLGNVVSFKLQSPEEEKTVKAKQQKGWRTRDAGDDETNPFPSFVGKTINDVFFFKNRLGFLTDSNVIFSEADEYFNFFRTTTQQLLDSAPIDVGLSHTKVAVLQYAKAFQEKLMLFSDSSQFVLRGADVLSPKTVAISPVSEYDTTDNVEPLVLGNYIYFPFNRDKYVGMYEYYVDSNTEVFEAQEITEHVSKYIPSSVRMMAGSTTQNTVLVQSLAEQSSLYVYKYFWSGKEKIQSAWQKFTIGGNDPIRGFDFVDSTLYLLVGRGGDLYLEKLILEEGYVDKGDGASLGEYFGWDSAYPVLLDCNTSYFEGVTHQYDAVNNVTTLSNIPLPVSADDVTNDVIQVWSKYGRKYEMTGTNPIATRVDDSTITIEGTLYDYVTYNGTIYKCNLSHDSGFRDKGTHLINIYKPDGSFGSTVWSTLTGDEAARVTTAPEWQQDVWYEGYENFVIGYMYNMLYKFSDQTLKQPTEKGGRSASNYTYQTLRTGSLNYADTGFFQVQVTPKHRDTYYYPFNSNLLGEGSLVNKFTPQDGHFRFPIQAQPGQVDIEITSSSALPVKLLGAEFESMIIPRTRRYGA